VSLLSVEEAKLRAAKAAVNEVSDGSILGLGTGSTVEYFAKLLGEAVKRGLRVEVVPTSYHSVQMAIENGLKLTPLELVDHIDLVVDGADEVDPSLNMIKGRGAALAKEKVVASMAERRVYVVSYDKLVEKLGVSKPLPVEVLPFAYRYAMKTLSRMGCKPELRMAGRFKDGPLVTDNGNFVLDCYFNGIDDPQRLEVEVKRIPGVVEVGLFCGLADVVYVGKPDGVDVLRRVK